ncbi:MAG: class I SAM-dependent methyltransferase [Candidatus Limnocylindria bacterium]
MSAAACRAAHLLVDSPPFIFEDRLALGLLDEAGAAMIPYHRASGSHPVLAGTRAVVATRSRFAEDRLALAVERGIDQYVILGAGLDSFAYRSPLASRVRVFEVDAPATQLWKREKAVGLDPIGELTFVSLDLRGEPVVDRLVAAGLVASRPAFVSWLGASFYLDAHSVASAVAGLAALAPGSEIAMDYVLPGELRDEGGRTYAGLAMPVAESSGEPWRSTFTPEAMESMLSENGFEVLENVGQRACIEPSLWQRSDALEPIGLWMAAHAIRRSD